MLHLFNFLADATVANVQLLDPKAFIIGCTAIGGGIAVLAGIGTGAGQGAAAAAAVTAVARQPEMDKEIKSTLILGDAIAETAAVFGLFISIVLIFTNIILNKYKG